MREGGHSTAGLLRPAVCPCPAASSAPSAVAAVAVPDSRRRRAARSPSRRPRPGGATGWIPLASPFSRSPFPVPRSRRCLFATSYPQRRVPKSACRKPSNSGQNRSKRRRFPSKRHQKSAHFVMPILTFWVVTPSGASARADLGFRKGKKASLGGAKWRPEKLSTICT